MAVLWRSVLSVGLLATQAANAQRANKNAERAKKRELARARKKANVRVVPCWWSSHV